MWDYMEVGGRRRTRPEDFPGSIRGRRTAAAECVVEQREATHQRRCQDVVDCIVLIVVIVSLQTFCDCFIKMHLVQQPCCELLVKVIERAPQQLGKSPLGGRHVFFKGLSRQDRVGASRIPSEMKGHGSGHSMKARVKPSRIPLVNGTLDGFACAEESSFEMGTVRGSTSQPKRHCKQCVSEIKQVFSQCPGKGRSPWRKSAITPDEAPS
jgi:hypothetical protein